MALRPKDIPETAEAAAIGMAHLSHEASVLAAAMPRLVLEARRIAASVQHGVHGRRRSGSGENFWQYRRFTDGEPAARVDWRRSARDDHLYVREREWEAAHTVWIWPDLSASMDYASPKLEPKRHRALVVALALAELLVKGGERVGVPDILRPTASRRIMERMAEQLLLAPSLPGSLPPLFHPSPLSEVVLLGDFWSPTPEVVARIEALAGTGAHGHVVQIVDPAEETFPFSGRIAFRERKAARASRSAVPKRGGRIMRRALPPIARPSAPPPTGSAGASASTARTGRRANCCWRCTCAWGWGMQARPDTGRDGDPRMMGLPLSFASPLLLTALLALPALWFLLRVVPPRPKELNFPPTRLLFDIRPKEETPARTPWWLTLLRLLLAALVILAAAGPIWNPPASAPSSSGPLVLVIDQGWPAAATWAQRISTANGLVDEAAANGRGVALIPTGDVPKDATLLLPAQARDKLRSLTPVAWAPARKEAFALAAKILGSQPDAGLVYVSDGVDLATDPDLAQQLAALKGARPPLVVSGGVATPLALAAPDNAAGALTVKVLRPDDGPARAGRVEARDMKGLALGEAAFSFGPGVREALATFNLPVDIRNEVSRLEIVGERSAGAVQLLDKRWRRRTVGVVSGASTDTGQPLLAPTYYLSRALGPFADLRMGETGAPVENINRFLEQRVPVIVLTDVGTIPPATRTRLARFVENGGVLVRFAGPRLANAQDDLLPVRLRRGGRTLGGSLSWETPQALGSLTTEGPFHDLKLPNDVSVNRQVLAEPDGNLGEHTWAALTDGTPLVTGAPRGRGMVVLFHVTADTSWSNLPLSGTFVDMLRRVIALSDAAAATDEGRADTAAARVAQGAVASIPPTRLLDGYGAFGPPGPTAKPVPANFNERASAEHPPGFYGPPDALLAVNALKPDDTLAPLDLSPLGATAAPVREAAPRDLRGLALLAAMALLLLDALAVLVLSGALRRFGRRATTAALLGALALGLAASLPLPRAGGCGLGLRGEGHLPDTPCLCHHRRCAGG